MPNDDKPKKGKGGPRKTPAIPTMEVQASPEQPHNGNVKMYPPGTAGLFGVEDTAGGGASVSPAREFMTAHTDNMQRLLAESVLSEDLINDLILLEADEQSSWGYVNMSSIAKMRVACTIGKEGRGRKDGVNVETVGVRSAIAKAQGLGSRLFGMGGGESPPPAPTQPAGMG